MLMRLPASLYSWMDQIKKRETGNGISQKSCRVYSPVVLHTLYEQDYHWHPARKFTWEKEVDGRGMNECAVGPDPTFYFYFT